MKIQAIGPRPIGADFFVEDTAPSQGTRPIRPHPQVLSPVGALSALAPRRRQPRGDSMAPRKPLEEVQNTFHARRKAPDKESESDAVSFGRAPVGASGPRPPVRAQRRRLAAHHREPDHHDTPHPQLNSGSAEALLAANQIQQAGRAERVTGLGPAHQVQLRQLPVDQASDSDLARFDRPRDRRGHSLAALQRLLGTPLPLQDPTQTHPERYDAAAKAALKQRIVEQGPSFRTSPEEHQEFREAFLFQAQADLPARSRAAGAALANEAYKALIGETERLKLKHPEVRHIPADDLAALLAFTGSHRGLVQEALVGDKVAANPLGLSFAKAVVSALHALPLSHTHQGPAFTRITLAAATALSQQHKGGEVRTEWQIFGASQARETAPPAGHAVLETRSLNAKNLAAFSRRPQEHELVFLPGTSFRSEGVTIGRALTAVQSELPPHELSQASKFPPNPPPTPAPINVMAARRAAAPAA
jgi:hypothetical protein